MGSKFSKAVRPHQAAGASRIKNVENDEPAKSKEVPVAATAPLLPEITIQEDVTMITAVSPEPTEPSPAVTGPVTEQEPEHPVEEDSLAVVEQELLSIEFGATDPDPPSPTVPYTPPPPPIPEIQCLICCVTLPREKEEGYAEKTIYPCDHCESAYCVDCVRNMFIQACNDMSRMAPRCCKPIHLHHVRRFLTDEEVATFKAKYEEWSTPNPLYCPRPTCSAFVPERLLPTKGRADSGVGTPTAQAFDCPTCQMNICLSCRKAAHPGSMCQINEEFGGVDADTAALLIQWGYKQCPQCKMGVKRMYGCKHMACRCGMHFCWVCLQDKDDCWGDCDDTDEGESEDEPDDENEEEAEPTSESATTTIPSTEDSVPEASDAVPAATVSTETPQPTATPRVRNLDGGSSRYWERRAGDDLYFGEEPNADNRDRTKICIHRTFETYKVSLGSVLTKGPSATDMECVKCWSVIHPGIEAQCGEHETMVPARPASRRGRIIPRGRGRGRGQYTPPRGLFRANATVGTAPHLTSSISLLSQSLPTREASPMDDVQFHRVVDTYGNTISTEEVEKPSRRASFDDSANEKPLDKFSFTFNAPSNVFVSEAPKFSLAYECIHCSVLLCETCKDGYAKA